MTRKDYELAAEHICEGNWTDYDRHLIADFCCKLFTADNEAFNKERFLEAADIEPDALDWHLGRT